MRIHRDDVQYLKQFCGLSTLDILKLMLSIKRIIAFHGDKRVTLAHADELLGHDQFLNSLVQCSMYSNCFSAIAMDNQPVSFYFRRR